MITPQNTLKLSDFGLGTLLQLRPVHRTDPSSPVQIPSWIRQV
jgi:hypothetical protein